MSAHNRVLVIDDEPEITEIIKAFLSNAGYNVEIENSPIEGLEKSKSFKPDVILLDIMMPVMDGYDVCGQLKKDPQTSHIPVLFLTGKDAKDDNGMSFQSGGDLFIKKPFSCERLLNMVKMVLISINR
jgi:DNA-binding response OmpR family regulator